MVALAAQWLTVPLKPIFRLSPTNSFERHAIHSSPVLMCAFLIFQTSFSLSATKTQAAGTLEAASRCTQQYSARDVPPAFQMAAHFDVLSRFALNLEFSMSTMILEELIERFSHSFTNTIVSFTAPLESDYGEHVQFNFESLYVDCGYSVCACSSSLCSVSHAGVCN